jgi:hypothetical protein
MTDLNINYLMTDIMITIQEPHDQFITDIGKELLIFALFFGCVKLINMGIRGIVSGDLLYLRVHFMEPLLYYLNFKVLEFK